MSPQNSCRLMSISNVRRCAGPTTSACRRLRVVAKRFGPIEADQLEADPVTAPESGQIGRDFGWLSLELHIERPQTSRFELAHEEHLDAGVHVLQLFRAEVTFD